MDFKKVENQILIVFIVSLLLAAFVALAIRYLPSDGPIPKFNPSLYFKNLIDAFVVIFFVLLPVYWITRYLVLLYDKNKNKNG